MARAKKTTKTDKPTDVEEINIDNVLAETPTVHGQGIQAYMREKIQAATNKI